MSSSPEQSAQGAKPAIGGAAGSGGAVFGGASGTTPQRRKGKGTSTINIQGGDAQMKAYPVTEDDLNNLAVIQGSASAFFALGGASFGFWINVSQQLDFADKDTPKEIIGFWNGLQTSSLFIAIACAILGVALVAFNGTQVRKIKRRTKHADAK